VLQFFLNLYCEDGVELERNGESQISMELKLQFNITIKFQSKRDLSTKCCSYRCSHMHIFEDYMFEGKKNYWLWFSQY